MRKPHLILCVYVADLDFAVVLNISRRSQGAACRIINMQLSSRPFVKAVKLGRRWRKGAAIANGQMWRGDPRKLWSLLSVIMLRAIELPHQQHSTIQANISNSTCSTVACSLATDRINPLVMTV